MDSQYQTSSERDAGIANEPEARPQFGNRFLTNPDDIFQHNAWDNVEWGTEQEELAREKVSENSSVRASHVECEKLELEADKMWDKFYGNHQNGFFKDRQWIFTEFPELSPGKKSSYLKVNSDQPVEDTSPSQPPEFKMKILEMGCGVGNTFFPILRTNINPGLFVYGCDFSSTAIEILKQNPEYNEKRCHAFVCDATADDWPVPFLPESLDIVILIFALSSMHPDKMQHVACRLFHYLKPGGLVLFRDYGRYDMAQLRFKKGKCLADNFYVRGDGTRVYFFTQEGLRHIFTSAGFDEQQNLVDRRLQVNRGRQLTMYRVWVQAKYRKPLVTPESTPSKVP